MSHFETCPWMKPDTSGRCWMLSQRLTTIIGRRVSPLSDETGSAQPTLLLARRPLRERYQVFPTLNAPERLHKTDMERPLDRMPLILSKCQHRGWKFFRACDTRERGRERSSVLEPASWALSWVGFSPHLGPLSPGVSFIVLDLEWAL